MPIRAGSRRNTRQLSREPDSEALPSLQKPKLPKLAGTPASRRQYTYGSGVEPPPSRPGRGIRADQPLDLGNAVGNVLFRQEQEDEDAARKQMPPPALPASDDEEGDELAADERAGLGVRQQSKRKMSVPHSTAPPEDLSSADGSVYDEIGYDQRRFAPAPLRSTREMEEMRDDRSFGTESDYYGDATIASSTGMSPPPSDARLRQSAQKKPSSLRFAHQPSPLESVDELAPSQRVQAHAPQHTEAELATPQSHNQPEAQLPSHRRLEVEDPEKSERQRAREANVQASQKKTSAKERSHPSQRQNKALDTSEQRQAEKTRQNQHLDPPRAPSSSRLTQETEIQTAARNAPARSSTRPILAGRDHDLANRPPTTQYIPSNYSEQDEALQKEIEASEADADEQRSPWQDSWIRIKSFSPFSPWRASNRDEFDTREVPPPRLRFEEPSLDEDEDEDEDLGNNDAADWWRLLSPWTYVDAFLGMIDTINDWIARIVSRAVESFRQYGGFEIFPYLILAVAGLSLAVWIPWGAIMESSRDLPLPSSFPRIGLPPLSGLRDLGSKIGDMAHSIPFHFGSRGDGLSSLWDLDDEGRHDVEDFLRKFDDEFKRLTKAGKLHETSLKKLEAVIPKVVHMELRDGKLVVAPEFWYAMRDLIRGDDSILTIEQRNGDGVLSSDSHWKAIAKKLANDPALTSKLNSTMGGIENRMNSKINGFWDSWVKDNDDKISGMLGAALERIQSAESERELSGIVKKLVKEQFQETDRTVVTRDEFLRHLRNEFAVHRSEIRAELDDIQPRLEQLVHESVKLATAKNTAPPAGMTRADVTTLVNELLRKALTDANLESMARGKIHVHWDGDIKNRVNYFSLGAGAITDGRHSSKTYDPSKKGVIDDEAYMKGLRGVNPFPPTAALMPWLDEGDCWCAARQTNYRGNPHGAALSVLLGHQIVPQHVVIEHILPGATIDPGARPRDIEVHASIEDPAVRDRLRDFSATHFPDPDPTEDWNATPADLPSRFVKIGQFVYEGDHDGRYVYPLSSELLTMGAETDQVVVRATSNYGAANHTCFYRVMLFGHRLDVDEQ